MPQFRSLRWRRTAFAAVVLAVLLAHGCVGQRLMSGALVDAPPSKRMRADYLQTLRLSPPQPLRDQTASPLVSARSAPPPRPSTGPRPAPRQARAAASAASAVPQPASEPVPVGVDSAAVLAAPDSASAVASMAFSPVLGPDGFRWPSAIRLSYSLRGYYRGEIFGGAQVEWLREEQRYQVHLDSWVGAQFAPFLSRSLRSEGRLGERGLVPQRYDQVTQFAFQEPVRHVVHMAPDGVSLSNGQRVDYVPDLQDTASQFIQLSWRLNMYPALAEPGTLLEMPLAMPRRVIPHLYEVASRERMATPMGEIDVLRVIPRTAARGGDLSAEIWLAPYLRFLPVRIRLRQDDETYVDLTLSRAPDVAEEAERKPVLP